MGARTRAPFASPFRYRRSRSRDRSILSLSEVGLGDRAQVGDEAAFLGELTKRLNGHGVRIPEGFVTTVAPFRELLGAPLPPDVWRRANGDLLPELGAVSRDPATLGTALEAVLGKVAEGDDPDEIRRRSALARGLCLAAPVPRSVRDLLADGYSALSALFGKGSEVPVAVSASPVREDSDARAFSERPDTLLNVRGIPAVVDAWRRCAAAAFTEGAVTDRLDRGLSPLDGGAAVAATRMVRSDLGSSGSVVTLDPDSGNRDVVRVSSSFGLGELVLGGGVDPDTFLVDKEDMRRGRPPSTKSLMGAKERMLVCACRCVGAGQGVRTLEVPPETRGTWSLEEADAVALARAALALEDEGGRPVHFEWARDGRTGELFLTGARLADGSVPGRG